MESKKSECPIKKICNKSPLRYPGGKTRGCKILDTILQEKFDLNTFTNIISPFFGGGSFEFYVQSNHGLNIIANDKFAPLYHFWNICKNDKDTLCENLYEYLDNVSKEVFMQFRDQILDEDDCQQALFYFIINRCSFSGATLSGGFSLESSKKRFTRSSVDRIGNLDLSRFSIVNEDFEEFLAGQDLTESIIFLDPPYYLEKHSKLYGNNGDLHETFEHDRLFEIISRKTNWIMTYNNCEYIKNLYRDYEMLDASWSYGMNKSKESSEIVIIG